MQSFAVGQWQCAVRALAFRYQITTHMISVLQDLVQMCPILLLTGALAVVPSSYLFHVCMYLLPRMVFSTHSMVKLWGVNGCWF